MVEGVPAPLLTTNNINNMTVWMNQENNINLPVQPDGAGSWWGKNNPLNNSLHSAALGYGSYSDLSVAAWWAALEIVTTFPGILAALNSDASPLTFSKAVIQSGWACSRYGVKAAGSDNCTEGSSNPKSPYYRPSPELAELMHGYWTAGTPTPPDLLARGGDVIPNPWKWWGDGLSPRGLNFWRSFHLKRSLPPRVVAQIPVQQTALAGIARVPKLGYRIPGQAFPMNRTCRQSRPISAALAGVG